MATILFVDDAKNLRKFCKMELEAEGYRVILAADGRDAILQLVHKSPDLIVLDIRMPRMNGLQAADLLRTIDPQIPIIFYTAYQEDWEQNHVHPAVNACVQKCEDLSELKATIASLLEARDLRKASPPG